MTFNAGMLNIDARPLTITGVTNSKIYDGSISAAAIPIITSGTLAPGDVATLSETYDSEGVGSGIALNVDILINNALGADVSDNYITTTISGVGDILAVPQEVQTPEPVRSSGGGRSTSRLQTSTALTAPTVGRVLGAETENTAAVALQIASIKAQLADLIRQLIALLQAQILSAQ
ncbi:MAG: YDG domain-containing protein [Minisyncoccia bacterium]